MTQRIGLDTIKALRENPDMRVWLRPPRPEDYYPKRDASGRIIISSSSFSMYRLVYWKDLQVQQLEWIVSEEIEITTGDVLTVSWGFTVA